MTLEVVDDGLSEVVVIDKLVLFNLRAIGGEEDHTRREKLIIPTVSFELASIRQEPLF